MDEALEFLLFEQQRRSTGGKSVGFPTITLYMSLSGDGLNREPESYTALRSFRPYKSVSVSTFWPTGSLSSKCILVNLVLLSKIGKAKYLVEAERGSNTGLIGLLSNALSNIRSFNSSTRSCCPVCGPRVTHISALIPLYLYNILLYYNKPT